MLDIQEAQMSDSFPTFKGTKHQGFPPLPCENKPLRYFEITIYLTCSALSVSSMKICCSFSFTKLMQNCSNPFF